MRVLMSMTIGLLVTAAAFAEDQPICPDAQTTIEIGECVSKEYDKADAELNAVWKKVMASFKKNDYLPAEAVKEWKDTMLAAQRDWIAFKEADCDAVGFEWYGGTGQGNAITFCLLGHTTARTKDLKARFLER
jgi:uncharacterized protein YecT (DUF1311 family)